MGRKILKPKQLDFQPRPAFPYSPGAAGGGMVYTAGQVAWDETGDVTAIGDVRAQTVQTLSNVKAVLEEAGATLDDVLKCNVYLKDIDDFQIMNEEFAKFFPDDPPARTTVQTRLCDPRMLVEIEAVAFIGDSSA